MIFQIIYPKYAHNLPGEDQTGFNTVIADETDISDKARQLSVNLHANDFLTVNRIS
jgi:hypothetical protein